jgi:diguanylate cyclase (GGDEF)-like protein
MLDNTQLVAFYFASTIGINVLCAVLLFFSGIKRKEPLHKALFVACLLTASYQYITWLYHGSTVLETSILLLKIQTGIIIFCTPYYAKIVFDWAGEHLKPHYLFYFTLLAITFFMLNLFSDYSLRFSSNVALVEYRLFSLESVTRLTGEANPVMMAFQLFAVLILIALIKVAYQCVVKRQKEVAVALSIMLAIQVFVVYNGLMLGEGAYNSIYFGGLPFTVFNLLVCISISGALHETSDLLKVQVRVRKKLESALAGLARGVSRSDDNTFFINMMKELQNLTGAHVCCIAALEQKDGIDYVKTQALVYRARSVKSKQYKVCDTSRMFMATHEPIWIQRNLHHRYPQIDFFKRIGAESYLSFPMINSDGVLEGNLILMFDIECERDDSLNQILNIFSSRAGAELQRSKVTQQLHMMAYYDYQTKLPNAGKANQHIQALYAHNAKNNTHSGVIMFELTKFTEVNRQFGFKYSEIAIQTLGERLANYCDDDISISRLGADEFVCIIENINPHAQGVMKLHWEAISLLVKKPIAVGELIIRLSCRGGGVIFPMQTHSSKEVLRCAEIAMSDAKAIHSNQLVFFSQDSLELVDRKELLLKLLEPAIHGNDELYAEFQPKVNALGEIKGCEALIRWNNKTVGSVSPDEFVSLAEESSLVEQLGLWMLTAVCKQINIWKRQGVEIDFKVAINVSPHQLAQDKFVTQFMEMLLHYEVSPKAIEIEITETSLLTNVDACISKLKQLRKIGVSIALDDFGTGYSSLSYINELPLDTIKIDRSFVVNLHKSNTLELARAIISLSHHMNVEVVAEGAETLEQVEILSEMGCDFFQGYYFAKPMDGETLTAWIDKNRATVLHRDTLAAPKSS